MKDFGAECRDVRFREVGVRIVIHSLTFGNVQPIKHNDPTDPRNPS